MYETETETGGPCLVRKLKWGAMASPPPLPPPVARPLSNNQKTIVQDI